MYAPDRDAGTVPMTPPGRDGNRNARYAYLVGRLRSRQITMEEATELFAIMQGIIQTSEAARAAMMRVPPPPTPTAPLAVPPPPPGPVAAGGEDLLLVGLLAMGAGAGLLAAMTKRLEDATPPAGSKSSARPNSVSTTRPG